MSGFGRVADNGETENDEIGVIVQAETREALENLDHVLVVEGVDCVFIGPADLSVAMGYRRNPGTPEVRAAIADAARRPRPCRKAWRMTRHCS